MVITEWGRVFTDSLQNLWYEVVDFLPEFLWAILIFVIGWIVAEFVKRGIVHLFKALNIDKMLSKTQLETAIERAGYKLNAGLFIGWLVKWFIIIVFLIASLDIVGLPQVNAFLTQVVQVYLPDVIIAALMLLVASVLADLADKVVSGSAKSAHMKSARMLGTVAKWAIWVFAILFALNQLGIGVQIINTLVIGFVAMLALAGGLAFGLGGQKAASDIVDKMKDQLSHKK